MAIIAGIELYLGTFLEVARRRNISRAAEALALSQTAVSWRVRALETQIGARLFERSGKGVKLTATGEVFLEHAVRITDATRQALIEAARVAPAEERISPRQPGKRGRRTVARRAP
jgi:LysR family pca operon transcriptional activator